MRARSIDRLLPLLLSLIPVLLLRPWELPLPAVDFASNFPAMMGGQSLLDAHNGLTRMVQEAGRHHPVWTFFIAAHWWFLGEGPLPWHVIHIITFVALVLMVYRQMVAAGASTFAAGTGLACALLGGAVFSSLEAPEIAEPLGLLFVFIALWAAGRLATATSMGRWTVAAVVAITASVLCKETFVIAVPAVLLAAAVALQRRTGSSAGAVRRQLLVLAVGIALAVGTFAVLPAAQNRLAARAGTSGAKYSAKGITGGRVVNVAAGMFLPVTRNPAFPANVAYIALAALGIGMAVARRTVPSSRLMHLAALAMLPALGVLMYLPWPAFPGYYGLVGMPLQAAVIALAVDASARSRSLRGLTLFLVFAVAGYGSVMAFNRGAAVRADGRLESRIVEVVRASAPTGITLVSNHEATAHYARSVAIFATLEHREQAANIRYVDCDATGSRCDAVDDVPGPALIMPGATCTAACQRPASRTVAECAVAIDYKSLRRSESCRTFVLTGTN